MEDGNVYALIATAIIAIVKVFEAYRKKSKKTANKEVGDE
jgi:hypothetical protein